MPNVTGAPVLIPPRRGSKAILQAAALGVMSTLILFLGFGQNQWHAADQDWFDTFQRDSESAILGRLVESRQAGILAYGGLTGRGDPTAPEQADTGFQYRAYLEGLKFDTFETYNSQIGVQGIFFSILDKAISWAPQEKLTLFRLVNSLLSALALSLIIVWFSGELGTLAALFVLATAVFSQWLTVFGRNLWWVLWAFYLPIVAVAFFLTYETRSRTRSTKALAIVVFLAVCVKSMFNGYEYGTTTLIMMTVPIVYYGIRNAWSLRDLVIRMVVAGASAVSAILCTFVILACQISAVEGSFADGIAAIEYALSKRTYGDPSQFPSGFTASLNAKPLSVVLTYLNGTAMSLGDVQVGFLFLIRLFLAITAVYFLVSRPAGLGEPAKRVTVALVCATWFSILAPLSWFVIFKAHSFIHTQINFITWHMPFTLFGFALCGLVVRHIAITFTARNVPRRISAESRRL